MNAPAGSMFDPSLFLQAETTETNVKRPPLPTINPTRPDGAYLAVIKSVEPTSGVVEKGDRAGQPWLSMVIQLEIQVPQQVQDQLGLKLEKGTISLTDRAFIDLTPQNTIDNSVGRNRRQRQYRDALDMNKPGDVWSWKRAIGQPIAVKIDHEIYNNEVQERPGALLKP